MTRWLHAGGLVVGRLDLAAFVGSTAFSALERALSSVLAGPMYAADSPEV